jgi:hypothetical protein
VLVVDIREIIRVAVVVVIVGVGVGEAVVRRETFQPRAGREAQGAHHYERRSRGLGSWIEALGNDCSLLATRYPMLDFSESSLKPKIHRLQERRVSFRRLRHEAEIGLVVYLPSVNEVAVSCAQLAAMFVGFASDRGADS